VTAIVAVKLLQIRACFQPGSPLEEGFDVHLIVITGVGVVGFEVVVELFAICLQPASVGGHAGDFCDPICNFEICENARLLFVNLVLALRAVRFMEDGYIWSSLDWIRKRQRPSPKNVSRVSQSHQPSVPINPSLNQSTSTVSANSR
jgi:hypothetical protein